MTLRVAVPFRRALAPSILGVAACVATTLPLALAPHDANACAGAKSDLTAYYDRAEAEVRDAGAVATDALVVITNSAPGSTPSASGAGTKISPKARLERPDGTPIALARDDFANAPPSAKGMATSVLRPAVPLAPNTDYVLFLERLGSTVGTPTTAKIAVRTGDGPRPLPSPPPLHDTGSVEVRTDVPSAETICCEGQGGCGPRSSCSPASLHSREVRRVSWPALSNFERGYWLEIESPRAGDEEGWTNGAAGVRRRQVSPQSTGEDVPLAAGERACVRLVVVDLVSDTRASSVPVCWDAAPSLAPPDDACPSIVQRLSVEAQHQAACRAKVERACPSGAPVGVGGTAGGAGGTADGAGRDSASGGAGAAATGASDGCSSRPGSPGRSGAFVLVLLGLGSLLRGVRSEVRARAPRLFPAGNRLSGGRRTSPGAASSSG